MIEVYSDGSSSGGSDGPGGWAYVLVKDGQVVHAGRGGLPEATNNQMEMIGAIEGLKAARDSGLLAEGEELVLVCDSQYVLGFASRAYWPKKNVDLAHQLRRMGKELGVATRWVPGHTYKRRVPWQEQARDVLLNERCDQLAKLAKGEQ